ncbi:YegS/Rv2252/BmrU family lipid kinase [Cellulosilyticum sp. I15G10I2]|uniref:YegS/Rv2252/BmrU family lipid kinase n=1 Tax=Cellulosilyticum sp. I15G10I2 TaxID=1892843 RepID=UPI00085BDC5A|nr:YegS/Rv2252/BmrU family lipid kinase [Cellulosilyticum sp. I15G10I2]
MNKEALLLYNPCCGQREVLLNLDYITSRVQDMGYNLKVYRSKFAGSIERYIIDKVDYLNLDMMIVSGGDGTVNECVNGMMKKKLNIPLAILPLGTANDFAHTLGIPSKLPLALDLIADNYLKHVDVGKANDKFFINVCSMGAFSTISQSTNVNIKNQFGKLAYYVKGLDAINHYEAMNLEVMTTKESFSNKFFLVLVFNGKGAGGFMKLANEADVCDGLFDIVCFKDIYFYDIPPLFFKVLQGEHLNNPNVIYFKTNNLSIKNGSIDKSYGTDIDGEHGPSLPLDISVVSNVLSIYTPRHMSHTS